MSESIRCYDVLVVGAGPAGLAAARVAASHGACVGLVDAQPSAGGQVWRCDVLQDMPGKARRAIAALGSGRIDWLPSTQVAMAQPGWLLAEGPSGALQLQYRALVLATGARELLLPFPGWTLPGVTGAGGAQALAKQGWPLGGKRVVVAGSGPLLLASAATLRAHGANVLGIHELISMRALRDFALRLPRWPGKAMQALMLRARLAKVPYCAGSLVVAAHGDGVLQEIEVEGPGGRERIPCDQLAVGYGLVPNTELPQLIGCHLEPGSPHRSVVADELLRTSVDGIFAAGEVIGIGGRDCALIEGEMAGHMAVGAERAARALQGKRRRARDFAALLQKTFTIDARVRALPTQETLICRCEDVPLGAVQGIADAREARLASRCGMGACQGRICGSALDELGIHHSGIYSDGGRRPPLFPVRLATLADSFSFSPQENNP